MKLHKLISTVDMSHEEWLRYRKLVSIKEAADRCRNGEAVYAARCIDGMSFREVAEAMMLLVMEIPVPETETKPEKVKKQPPQQRRP